MKSDRVAHSSIQSGLADHQGWRLYNLPEHPASLLDCPQRVKNPLPYIQPEPLLFPFMSVISCPPTMFLCEEPSSIFSLTFSQVLGSCLWSHLFPGWTSPGPRVSPQSKCSSHDQLGGSPLNLLLFNIFLVLAWGGAQNWMQYLDVV